MAILAECPGCRKKQAVKNKLCKCGEDLVKAKRSKKVKYWISYYLPNRKQKREYVGSFKDLKGYSIEDARTATARKQSKRLKTGDGHQTGYQNDFQ